jgi:hypothetical protein
MSTLQQLTDKHLPRAIELCRALRAGADELFGEGVIDGCDAGTAAYRLERDPASGRDSLVGEWLDPHGHPRGMMVFHPDGACFGEYDIVRMHPTKTRWFVEAIEAWGGSPDEQDRGVIRAELRLLAAPEP